MQQQQTEIIIFIAAFFAAFVAFFSGVILFIRQAKKNKTNFISEKEVMKNNHLQELLSTQLEMQTQTMQYIGREIHDSVGQKLTLASLYTQQLAYENKAPLINYKIENISHIINESLVELRQLSKSLTDDSIADNTITALLQQECNKVNDTKKCRVNFTGSQQNIQLTYQSKSILVRIVQEFLQNSIKHAGCKNIDVSLSNNSDVIFLILRDDGKGFDLEKAGDNGIGLNNMKKRAGLIGGVFKIESIVGSGTNLTIEIPLQKN